MFAADQGSRREGWRGVGPCFSLFRPPWSLLNTKQRGWVSLHWDELSALKV